MCMTAAREAVYKYVWMCVRGGVCVCAGVFRSCSIFWQAVKGNAREDFGVPFKNPVKLS